MPFIFEVSIDGEKWEDVPEQIFYDALYRYAKRITPLIRDMLNQKVVSYGSNKYRIRCDKKD